MEHTNNQKAVSWEKNTTSNDVGTGSVHTSVLLNEIIGCLNIHKGDIVLDATVNGGGHSKAIADRFGTSVKIIGLDADAGALLRAKKNIPHNPILLNYNFRNLDLALEEAGVPKVKTVIFDLGLSSDQLEQSQRGFSFQKDEPLVMTFDAAGTGNGFTASDIVNAWDESNIKTIIESYGEDRFAGRIARGIVEARGEKPITSSKVLADIIKNAYPAKYRYGKTHPATKTFQALRMTVNDELQTLRSGLQKAFDHLEHGGRLMVISFHSLEDRIVKQFMKQQCLDKQAIAITKKPMVPTKEEILRNPRSRSAKLRILERI